jgi:hypothetical protein
VIRAMAASCGDDDEVYRGARDFVLYLLAISKEV